MVLGNAEDMLDHCDGMISKSSGEMKQMPASLKSQIKFTHESMNRRFMSTSIIAYFVADC